MATQSSLVEKNVNLAPFNTLQVQADAAYFSRVQTKDDLVSLVTTPKWTEKPIFILGGGSNVLFVDDFGGLIIHLAITGKEIIEETPDYVKLKIGAGENWHETVRYCVQKGWGGIENLSLIPGTVGAAPIQNIGAYGVELEDVFESLTAIELSAAKERIFSRKDCRFGYRDSIFKQELKGKFVVTDVTLKLQKQPDLNTSYGAIQHKLDEKNINEPTIKDISDVVIEIRNSKLPNPTELANAGSFFKNPIVSNSTFKKLSEQYANMPGYPVDQSHTKVPAGWLIEEAGWKGKVVGNVGTYRQQALVIVNHGGASGDEILELAKKIQQAVLQQFDIELVPEVNIVG